MRGALIGQKSVKNAVLYKIELVAVVDNALAVEEGYALLVVGSAVEVNIDLFVEKFFTELAVEEARSDTL